jgi:DNA-directed RNA polymerase specialized sigma24 family protein
LTRTATASFELEELRVVAAARAGDKDSYRQLLARHQADVFHVAYLLTGSASQARALTLQTFLHAWASLRRVPATVPFREWLISIAAQLAGEDASADARLPGRRLRAQLHQATELEARLRAAAVGVELPPAPDIATAVVARLDHYPRRRRRPFAVLATACAVAAAAALLVIHALSLAAGANVHPRAPAIASLSPRAGLERFPLGERIPLGEARHAASFTALIPPTLDGAYVGRDVPGGRVSLFAGRLLITEFRGTAFPYILSLIGPGTHAELTWVNGRPGVYGSSVRALAPGDVLTWLQGPLTLRIEGAQTLEQALALARTLS